MKAARCRGEGIVYPLSALPSSDQVSAAKVAQVPGRGGLRHPKDLDNVPDAKLARLKQVENAQPSFIRKGPEFRVCTIFRLNWHMAEPLLRLRREENS